MNKTWNYRIQFGRDVWRSPGPTPCSKQGQLDKVTQGRVQPRLDYVQKHRFHKLSR